MKSPVYSVDRPVARRSSGVSPGSPRCQPYARNSSALSSRKDAVDAFRLKCLRFEFCPEITAKFLRSGSRILEVPISYNARNYSEGKKIRWYDGVDAIWALIKYRFVPLRSFVISSREISAGPETALRTQKAKTTL